MALLFSLIASCGKAPTMSGPNEGKSSNPLNGKTNSEILTLKYNNQVDLNCVVRVQKGRTVDLNTKPVDEFTWQLTSELSMMRVLNYKIADRETILVMRLAAGIQFQDILTHVAENRVEYFMEFTPVQKVLFRRAPKSILSNGSVHDRSTFTGTSLFENVETRLYTMTTERDDEVVTEDVRCKLVTRPNRAYRDQWRIVK